MKNKFIINEFYCTQCGARGLPVHRKLGQEREPGHLKKLFCLKCCKETNHVEIRSDSPKYDYETFKIEYEYGNFDIDGNRIEENYKIFRNKVENGEINKQKTLDNVRDSW